MTAAAVVRRLINACPFEVYLLALCLFSSLSILTGVTPEPNSIEAVLSPVTRTAWAIGLTLGAGMTMIGSLLKLSPIIRIGCTLLAPTAGVYGIVILYVSGKSGLLPGFLILGLGIAAALRAVQITLGLGHG